MDLESAVLRIPEKAFSSRWRRRHFSLLDFLRNATGATSERPSTPAVERLQRAGARAVGALTFGHACRAPGERCATDPPDAARRSEETRRDPTPRSWVTMSPQKF